MGITTILKIWTVYNLLTKDGYRVIYIGHNRDNNNSFINSVKDILGIINELNPRTIITENRKGFIKLWNGSSIKTLTLTPDAFSGYFADEVILNNIQYKTDIRRLLPAILPATKKITIEQTGTYVNINNFFQTIVKWDEFPRDDNFKEEMIKLMGEDAWENEYELNGLEPVIKNSKSTTIQTRITPEIMSEVESRAEITNKTVSEYIRELILSDINNNKQV